MQHKACQSRPVAKNKIANILNFINFQGGTIRAVFQHPRYATTYSFKAQPMPLLSDYLECVWVSEAEIPSNIADYRFVNVLLDDDLKLIEVKAEAQSITKQGIRVSLADSGCQVSCRSVKRRPSADDITAELMHNSALFRGTLADFHAVSFSVEVVRDANQSFFWLNASDRLHVVLKSGIDIIYAGECLIVRQTADEHKRILVLQPLRKNVPRFSPKSSRCHRYHPVPSPIVSFQHPLTHRSVHLRVDEISGAGFSVHEYYDSSVLVPGLVLPEIRIEIVHNSAITCKGQVIHSSIITDNEERMTVKSGIGYLDMKMKDQTLLSNYLARIEDSRTHTCGSVDLDALWQLFFESGFIYPEKYASISRQREKFKETYRKLYRNNPDICRHFTYQDKGELVGHIAMIHAYEKTWLFHHMAATARGLKAGLAVLSQGAWHVNACYLQNGTPMDYLLAYYRQENRTPRRLFGGFKEKLSNPAGCTIDPIAFSHISKNNMPADTMRRFLQVKDAEVIPARSSDIAELEEYYNHISGGLMLRALDLTVDTFQANALSNAYANCGFSRTRHVFSLIIRGRLHAIMSLTSTDIGMNLSNVTDCIKVFAIEHDELDTLLLSAALAQITHLVNHDEITVMTFPVEFVIKKRLPMEKIYNIWVLCLAEGAQAFLKHIDEILPPHGDQDAHA
ncbi:MAG TPA: hypothetical protein VLH56_13820 [Dissulfurispiraceae bacterium]|nr:hypothetical protein [Dissulfurispiraceae bacterium]